MCFSAAASFAGGAIISSIGVPTIRKRKERSQRLFSFIPLIFGLQQLSEGVVWLALRSPGHGLALKVSTYLFLTAALVVWPTIVPLSMLVMEKSDRRRRALRVPLAAGIIASACYAIGMAVYKASAQISGFHILYAINAPYLPAAVLYFFYLAATLPPFFISSRSRMSLLGTVMTLSYLATIIFYREYLISVWCFFAALASAVIWWIAGDGRQRAEDGLKLREEGNR